MYQLYEIRRNVNKKDEAFTSELSFPKIHLEEAMCS